MRWPSEHRYKRKPNIICFSTSRTASQRLAIHVFIPATMTNRSTRYWLELRRLATVTHSRDGCFRNMRTRRTIYAPMISLHGCKSFVQGSDMQCSLLSSSTKLVAYKQHCRHVVQNEDKKDAHPPTHPQNSQRSNPISSLSYRYHAHHISPLPCAGRVGSVGRGQHVAITSCRLSNLAITCCHPTPLYRYTNPLYYTNLPLYYTNPPIPSPSPLY